MNYLAMESTMIRHEANGKEIWTTQIYVTGKGIEHIIKQLDGENNKLDA